MVDIPDLRELRRYAGIAARQDTQFELYRMGVWMLYLLDRLERAEAERDALMPVPPDFEMRQ